AARFGGAWRLGGGGGGLAERVGDAALRLLPLTADEVGAMIDGLKLARRLSGFRGGPPIDRAALEAAALALGRFFLDHRARIKEIQINPLIVRAREPIRDRRATASKPGKAATGAIAVDVRVLWHDGAEKA